MGVLGTLLRSGRRHFRARPSGRDPQGRLNRSAPVPPRRQPLRLYSSARHAFQLLDQQPMMRARLKAGGDAALQLAERVAALEQMIRARTPCSIVSKRVWASSNMPSELSTTVARTMRDKRNCGDVTVGDKFCALIWNLQSPVPEARWTSACEMVGSEEFTRAA